MSRAPSAIPPPLFGRLQCGGVRHLGVRTHATVCLLRTARCDNALPGPRRTGGAAVLATIGDAEEGRGSSGNVEEGGGSSFRFMQPVGRPATTCGLLLVGRVHRERTSWAREAELLLLLLTDGEIRRPPDSTAEEPNYHVPVKPLGIMDQGDLSLNQRSLR